MHRADVLHALQQRRWAGLTLATAACLAACSDPAIVACVDAAGAHALCGIQNPEDLAVLPGNQALLVSEFGSMDEDKPGALAWLDLKTEKLTALFPQGGPGVAPQISEGPDWGDEHCPGPPDQRINPQGIDLHRRQDGGENGALELFVVNHGGRESIELFELSMAEHTLSWRGCVPMPEGTFLNDVAALPDAGFATTHMFPKSFGASAKYQLARAAVGGNTGYVLVWHPGGAVNKLAGSDAPFPNGIAATPDGRELYVDEYMANEVRHLALPSGKLLGKASVEHPDNITWSDDGTLLMASHTAGLRAMGACGQIERGACAAEFAIVGLDPKTMRTHVVVQRQGPPMGAATVAVPVGREWFIGSYKSDRMLRLPR